LRLSSDLDPVQASAILAFGSTYVHPLAGTAASI
jgi:hypothetical protein